MNLYDAEQVTGWLQRRAIVGEDETVEVVPLSGGISSDVVLAISGEHRWVIKQVLPKLKVAADWQADVRRGQIERQALRVVADMIPGSVPCVEYYDNEGGVLVMNFVNGVMWKSELLAGRIDKSISKALGQFLGKVHHDTHNHLGPLSVFEDKSLFYQLRIAPYFEVLYAQYPVPQQRAIREIVDTLMQQGTVLVHGDFSPKNIIVSGVHLNPIVLDWEVAHLGHPAFDLAFMMHHLWLKAIYSKRPRVYGELVQAFYGAYGDFSAVSSILTIEVIRTTGALMLARVDGKSPVDYLDASAREIARRIGSRLVLGEVSTVVQVADIVREELGSSAD
ncbi:MAG: hypothetical protein C7B45_10865 [Sulfobacillus acidophilus]|uniref:Aminoglycoside phosphotransferase domain-containing protein n=1 Tax=Sulfobacillus acidophilus TaxID=53633 RepID=A0A2T2WGS7_9FIRM|nr:MAG: hypothetical protein C7B45_10865 [Sulfobacillus acidophilus]